MTAIGVKAASDIGKHPAVVKQVPVRDPSNRDVRRMADLMVGRQCLRALRHAITTEQDDSSASKVSFDLRQDTKQAWIDGVLRACSPTPHDVVQ
jgi:hypothetical protein